MTYRDFKVALNKALQHTGARIRRDSWGSVRISYKGEHFCPLTFVYFNKTGSYLITPRFREAGLGLHMKLDLVDEIADAADSPPRRIPHPRTRFERIRQFLTDLTGELR